MTETNIIQIKPPTLNLEYKPPREVMRGLLDEDISYQLILSCALTPEKIDKLIMLLKAQKIALENNSNDEST